MVSIAKPPKEELSKGQTHQGPRHVILTVLVARNEMTCHDVSRRCKYNEKKKKNVSRKIYTS